MDIVTLNEQLRHEFSSVLRQLQQHQIAVAAVKQQPPAARVQRAANSASNASAPPSETAQQSAALPPSPPLPVAAKAPETALPLPQQLVRIDHYKHHCHTILHRLNTYQYGTTQAFKLDVEQLRKVARTNEQQQELQVRCTCVHVCVEGCLCIWCICRCLKYTHLQRLMERISALHVPQGNPEAQVYGNLQFDTTAGIPDLQEIDVDGTAKKWLVNVNIQEHSVPIGTYLTRENALKAYELWRFDLNTSRSGVARVYKLAEQLAQGQRESDEQVVQAAMTQCHPEKGWLQRRQDMVSLSVHPVVPPGGSSSQQQEHPNRVEKELGATAFAREPRAWNTPTKPAQRPAGKSTPSRAVAMSSPTPSSQSTQSPQLTPATSASSSKWRNPKRKKPPQRLSQLRLRRLIQKRLCPHLKDKEVCVLRRPEMVHEERTNWTPTGRLEAGQVFSYKRDKLVTFAEYVLQEMGHAVSACPHMFLVKTRESIDDHLLVCDTFSEEERIQLGQDFFGSCQKYINAPEPTKATGRRR